ncbi:hypothetical protein ASG42_26440 [Rhizobium sp. Leaf391]|uniref:hypothetical protein n=1 Tax=Rhizobium sp. Leaf391 TaxID=1736360 RepID=UPI000714C8D3|nr:hypothetical protein [Rhizobium sp. Leaf391]KQT01561.1 hypothetical protein ASG42_26440 [Rhizobium sp. Leaf391]
MNAYLVHFLSAADLDAIAKAGSARARIANYAQRLPGWISAVQGVAVEFQQALTRFSYRVSPPDPA